MRSTLKVDDAPVLVGSELEDSAGCDAGAIISGAAPPGWTPGSGFRDGKGAHPGIAARAAAVASNCNTAAGLAKIRAKCRQNCATSTAVPGAPRIPSPRQMRKDNFFIHEGHEGALRVNNIPPSPSGRGAGGEGVPPSKGKEHLQYHSPRRPPPYCAKPIALE